MGGTASDMMGAMFGGESVSDTWLQSRGEAMGRDMMSIIVADMYDDDELELPATTRRAPPRPAVQCVQAEPGLYRIHVLK